MGSPNKFGWPTTENVTFRWKATKISSEIPPGCALRFCLFASLNPQNFDFAQDDRLFDYLVGFVCLF